MTLLCLRDVNYQNLNPRLHEFRLLLNTPPESDLVSDSQLRLPLLTPIPNSYSRLRLPTPIPPIDSTTSDSTTSEFTTCDSYFRLRLHESRLHNYRLRVHTTPDFYSLLRLHDSAMLGLSEFPIRAARALMLECNEKCETWDVLICAVTG